MKIEAKNEQVRTLLDYVSTRELSGLLTVDDGFRVAIQQGRVCGSPDLDFAASEEAVMFLATVARTATQASFERRLVLRGANAAVEVFRLEATESDTFSLDAFDALDAECLSAFSAEAKR